MASSVTLLIKLNTEVDVKLSKYSVNQFKSSSENIDGSENQPN